jgi:hypothetical protein
MAGDRSCFFSIEINHGGYFLGSGANRSYVSGSVIWYDDLDMVSWSHALLENIVEEIGYEMCGRIKVYYCIPFLTLARNGLRQLRDADDSDRMLAFVDMGHHFISLYLDHELDDVVYYPVTTLPSVISPGKPSAHTEAESNVDAAGKEDEQAGEEEDLPHVPLQVVLPDNVPADECISARTRQRKRARRQTIPEDEADDVQEIEDEDDHDSDYDPEDIVDSDYGMNEGDDDLFEDNVDDAQEAERHGQNSTKKSVQVKEKAAPTFAGKGKACKEENSEEEDLWGPESDDDTAPLRFKTFRDVDLADPHFHVGQTFESVELLRKAIQAYSCKHRKDIRLPVNDLKRLNGRCTEECSWYLWASFSSITKCFMIKKYNGEHTCGSNFKVHSFTSNFLAQKYLESFRADQDMNMKNFSRIVQKDWCMTPGRCKLQRARRLAMKIIYGDEEGQYKLLWDYGNEIRRSNPGSSFYVSLDENSRFKRCYMCLEASKKGFLQGCRPVIFLDGCFIKTRYRGQLLAVVGVDPNDCIFPIDVAAVEVEDTANWTWFLDTLKADLGIENTAPWTVMSDKQKVINLRPPFVVTAPDLFVTSCC